jgi:hypothetical protein
MNRTGAGLVMLFLAIGTPPANLFPRVLAADAPGFSARPGARLTGRVVVLGDNLKPPDLPVFKSRAVCGAAVANETLLVGKDGGLQNAVISLRPRGGAAAPPPARIILDNRRCAFSPHVQVTAVGSELLLKNSDPILHTVHARLGSDTLFNVGLPKWRQVTKLLDRPGVIKIDCDVLHTWMSAVIVVTTAPHFAVTDAKGEFSLDGLWPGEYEAQIWHEKLGAKTTRLSITADSVSAVEVAYVFPNNNRKF